MIKGWKKLTKAEIKHLCDMCCNNTFRFQRTLNEQAKAEAESGLVACYECKEIAKKLGMTPEKEVKDE